jgi:hypothetical protein
MIGEPSLEPPHPRSGRPPRLAAPPKRLTAEEIDRPVKQEIDAEVMPRVGIAQGRVGMPTRGILTPNQHQTTAEPAVLAALQGDQAHAVCVAMAKTFEPREVSGVGRRRPGDLSESPHLILPECKRRCVAVDRPQEAVEPGLCLAEPTTSPPRVVDPCTGPLGQVCEVILEHPPLHGADTGERPKSCRDVSLETGVRADDPCPREQRAVGDGICPAAEEGCQQRLVRERAIGPVAAGIPLPVGDPSLDPGKFAVGTRLAEPTESSCIVGPVKYHALTSCWIPPSAGRYSPEVEAMAISQRDQAMTRDERWRAMLFDPVPKFGSPEHYFHFLLGYLLLGLHAATAERQVDGIVFRSCGPTMDPRIREACALLGLQCVIEPPLSGLGHECGVRAPRWDRWLRRGRPDGIEHADLTGARLEPVGDDSVPDSMRAIRDRLLNAAAPHAEPSGTGPWLLLRRSPEPDFYRRGGPAENPGYGSGRRAIGNLDELAGELTGVGLAVRIYEPGAADLADQIRTFHNARGVIAIRGAELANLIWMAPGSRVVMLATPMRTRETYVSWNLAAVMGIEFTQIVVDSDFPRIASETVLPWLAGQGTLGGFHEAGLERARAAGEE